MANFGIGLGAFVDGFNKGWNIGENITSGIRRNKSMQARKKITDEAKGEYDMAVADDVLTQAGQADPNQAFDVEGAAKASRKKTSFTDFLYKEKMPQIIDAMAEAGDLEGAQSMSKWAEDRRERKVMDGFGRALGHWSAGKSSGNYEPFAKSAMDLLNDGGYDIKATGYDLVKDDQGNTTGLSFSLKQGDNEYKHTFNSIDEAASFLSSNLSPQNRVKQWESERKAAQDLTAKRIEANIGLGKELAVEGVKQQGRVQLEGVKHGNNVSLDDHKTGNELWKNAASANSEDPRVRAAASTKAQILRESGYGEEQINKWMPALLGVREDQRQAMSDDDLVRFAMEALAKTDEEYMDGDQATKQRLVGDFIRAFRDQARSIAPQSPAPGLGAPQQPAPIPRY